MNREAFCRKTSNLTQLFVLTLFCSIIILIGIVSIGFAVDVQDTFFFKELLDLWILFIQFLAAGAIVSAVLWLSEPILFGTLFKLPKVFAYIIKEIRR